MALIFDSLPTHTKLVEMFEQCLRLFVDTGIVIPVITVTLK